MHVTHPSSFIAAREDGMLSLATSDRAAEVVSKQNFAYPVGTAQRPSTAHVFTAGA